MSYEAMAWAIQQSVGSPSARCVLMSIANYANEDWCCWPKQETIARQGVQSVDSVQRRMPELMGAGILRRVKLKRFGRRVHDFYILAPSPFFAAPLEDIRPLLPASCDVIEDAEHAAADCGGDKTDTTLAPSDEPENHAAADCGSVQSPTLPQSAVNATALVRQQEPVNNQESKTKPQTPFRKEAERGFEDQKSDQEEKTEKRWERFRSISYPDGILDLDKARVEFGKLSEDDQEAAIIGLPAYSDVLRKRRQKSKAAHLYFRQRVWRDLIGKVQESKTGPTLHDPKSLAGRALLALCDIWRWTPLRLGDGRISHLKPITPQLLGMAQAPPKEQWACYEAGSREYAAWRNFFVAVFGRSPFARAEIEVPWDWPPSIEGKIYTGESAPPGTLSEEDIQALSGT